MIRGICFGKLIGWCMCLFLLDFKIKILCNKCYFYLIFIERM